MKGAPLVSSPRPVARLPFNRTAEMVRVLNEVSPSTFFTLTSPMVHQANFHSR
jgi:hypothetical protein